MKDDSVRCVVLGRSGKSSQWDLIIISPSKASAWRFANGVEKQEENLGNKRFECMVVTEEDFDRKRINPQRPPKDFDFSVPMGAPVVTPVAKAPAPRKISPWMMPPEPTRAEPQKVAAPIVTPEPPPLSQVKPSGYQPKKCPYCTSDVPSNGAAQFSHLKKHVNELVGRKVLTAEQAALIRSTKLNEEMLKIFSEAYKLNPVPVQV